MQEEFHVNGETGFLQRRGTRLTLMLLPVSLAAVFFYSAKQELLLYGDAVAHINIARRVVDNRHPLESFGQLGTVWLPLQHMAMLPFVWSDSLWRSGIAGAIPGMFAYILGALGIFRLVNGHAPKIVAYIATGIYAFNPNLLYMQSTAMNEAIFLAFFIWTLVYLDDFLCNCFPNLDAPIRPARVRPASRSKPAASPSLQEHSRAMTDGSSVPLSAQSSCSRSWSGGVEQETFANNAPWRSL